MKQISRTFIWNDNESLWQIGSYYYCSDGIEEFLGTFFYDFAIKNEVNELTITISDQKTKNSKPIWLKTYNVYLYGRESYYRFSSTGREYSAYMKYFLRPLQKSLHITKTPQKLYITVKTS